MPTRVWAKWRMSWSMEIKKFIIKVKNWSKNAKIILRKFVIACMG